MKFTVKPSSRFMKFTFVLNFREFYGNSINFREFHEIKQKNVNFMKFVNFMKNIILLNYLLYPRRSELAAR